MLRPKSIALVNQRRTLRALYAQTQAYPYAAVLSGGNATGSDTFTNFVPSGTESQDALRLVDGSTGVGIYPGAVLTLTDVLSEKVALADAVTQRPFGLSANFVGGNMDELNGRSEIGVWRGRGGVFQVLAPVFDSNADLTGTDDLVTDVTANKIGRLTDGTVSDDSPASSVFGVARKIAMLSENSIIVELTVGG